MFDSLLSHFIVASRIRLPTGTITKWAHITGPDVVAGVVVTKKLEVILTKQFRMAANGMLIEIPAGKTTAKEKLGL